MNSVVWWGQIQYKISVKAHTSFHTGFYWQYLKHLCNQVILQQIHPEIYTTYTTFKTHICNFQNNSFLSHFMYVLLPSVKINFFHDHEQFFCYKIYTCDKIKWRVNFTTRLSLWSKAFFLRTFLLKKNIWHQSKQPKFWLVRMKINPFLANQIWPLVDCVSISTL